MSRGVWYIVALVLVIIIVVGIAGEYSLRSVTCMACHSQEASFAQWMAARLKADKKGFSHELIACADCHIEGTAAGTLVSRLRGLFHVVTYVVPQIEPRRAQVAELVNRARIPSENCQYCHLAAIYRKEVYLRDLPPAYKRSVWPWIIASTCLHATTRAPNATSVTRSKGPRKRTRPLHTPR